MTGIFPDADKSSLSRTFSFHFRQQRGTWSGTHKDGSLGMGEGHPQQSPSSPTACCCEDHRERGTVRIAHGGWGGLFVDLSDKHWRIRSLCDFDVVFVKWAIFGHVQDCDCLHEPFSWGPTMCSALYTALCWLQRGIQWWTTVNISFTSLPPPATDFGMVNFMCQCDQTMVPDTRSNIVLDVPVKVFYGMTSTFKLVDFE